LEFGTCFWVESQRGGGVAILAAVFHELKSNFFRPFLVQVWFYLRRLAHTLIEEINPSILSVTLIYLWQISQKIDCVFKRLHN
jgi:hypothetical protein